MIDQLSAFYVALGTFLVVGIGMIRVCSSQRRIADAAEQAVKVAREGVCVLVDRAITDQIEKQARPL
jgi:hypothetical protein